jgi:hypothetical protein
MISELQELVRGSNHQVVVKVLSLLAAGKVLNLLVAVRVSGRGGQIRYEEALRGWSCWLLLPARY